MKHPNFQPSSSSSFQATRTIGLRNVSNFQSGQKVLIVKGICVTASASLTKGNKINE